MILILILLLTGCKINLEKEINSSFHYTKNVYTEKELQQHLHKGMSEQDVIKKFGIPTLRHKYDEFEDKVNFTYVLKPQMEIENLNPNRHIEGFSIYFENDKVCYWCVIWGRDADIK